MDGLVVTQKDIEEYLNQRSGLTENTRSTYRARLNQLYDLLPQDKTIHRGTIKSIGETLLQRRYSKQAVNIVLAAADGFVVWSGHPEFQAVARYAQDDLPQPELTRTEYQRLLMAAKRLNREREYLLIKTIVLTGSNLPELMALTAEDVKKGKILVGTEVHTLPQPLQAELISYAHRHPGTGPLFQNYRGDALTRTAVTQAIKGLSREAQVAENKCNPRCLRRLYQETQSHYRDMMQSLMDQASTRQLESEQRLIGWAE